MPAFLPGQRLIEPFSGSGAIFMNTNYESYLLAESNNDLISIFNRLQHQGQAFINYCQEFFQPEFNKPEQYYALRSEFNTLPISERRSALFLYLNRHGYNGLCRYNSKGIFNVPFGRYINPYFPINEMTQFHQKSQHVQFLHADFKETFQLAKKGDVIYCDPPYVPLSENKTTVPYTQKKFEERDQIELAELAKATAARGIPVIISNHDTEFTRHHYQSAQITSFNVTRVISCHVNLRQPVKELIAVFTV
jgi:DNA adenine methylase